MSLWLLLAVNSITLGGLLFLLAAGFSLIFGLMRIPNLAHGSFFMLGAYFAVSLIRLGMAFWPAALLAGLGVALFGGIVERLILRRLAGAELAQVLVTLGLSFMVADVCLMVWTGDPIQIDTPALLRGATNVAGLAFPTYRLAVSVIAVIVAAALWILIDRTRLGAMIRAGVDDPAMARVTGIRVSRLFTIVFCLGAWLAGFAGVIGGPILSVYPGLDQEMLPLALVVVILGGSGSLLGCLAGSLIVGFLYNFGQALLPRAGLRRALPADADRPRAAAPGPVRAAGGVKRLALAAALLVLAALPLWVGNTFYVNIATQILLYAVFALGINVLVGYAGLVTLGHAGLFGIAAYAGARMLNGGHGHAAVAAGALVAAVVVAALFAVLALRGTGLGFVMITVALGQIVWGIAYRWISITNGDNGISIKGRPSPLGLSLASPAAFYWAVLIVFVVAVASMAVLVASPFGASLRGTRDQPRRMQALGYHVWMIRFIAFVFSGFWSGVAGLLYLYYHQFVSPHAVALSASAEALLMVISGGTGTLLGPIAGAALVVVMKNVASAYVERWNFVLGAIFVVIVVFMPEGFVPGTVRLWRWAAGAWRPRAAAPVPAPGEEGMTALDVRDLEKSFGGPPRHGSSEPHRRGGRAPLDHRTERRREDHALQPHHRRAQARPRLDRAVRS
jgi:ABC-type branched-subunit amino acid transport system permease subunit